MNKTKFTETQTVFAIEQSETGTSIKEVCRKMGISEATLKGPDVVNVLNELKVFRNIIPQRIKVDNGSEFISKQLDRWAPLL